MLTTLTAADGTRFRDLDHDGVMAPYEDPRRTPEERVADLVPRLSAEEKAGLLFVSIHGAGEAGDHDAVVPPGRRSTREAVRERFLNHFNLRFLPSPRRAAAWQNAVQELAAGTPHGIPVTFSTDPRHGAATNEGTGFAADGFSRWPEALGLGALGDVDVVRRFADVVRQEYRAVGLRQALHPQIDLATEPRWGRQMQTFGQDEATTSRLVTAYLQGLQGDDLATGVAATTKHFPGGGPQRDGEDPHFAYGREQVYPGGRFEEHLAPFRAAIAAGTAAVMPYYGMPVGLELDGRPVEQVGFSFSRAVVTGLLREQLGYDGVVVTDWGLVTDGDVAGKPFPARAWGVESLSELERVERILDAGCDQLGGEDRVDLVLELLRQGRVDEARLDTAATRLLLVKFRLGLFDDPFVDEDAAEGIVGAEPFAADGLRAQSASMVVLAGRERLPLGAGTRVLAEGLDPAALAARGLSAASAEDAEVAVVRLQAPFEPRDHYFLESAFHQGSLEFPPGTASHLRDLAARMPVVLDVALDRPAILTPLVDSAAVLLADFGSSDDAVLDVLTGRTEARGRLPFELPRSEAAVAASRPDVPSDTEDPLFPYAFPSDAGAA